MKRWSGINTRGATVSRRGNANGETTTIKPNVVGVKQPGGSFTHPRPDSVLSPGCLLLVAGEVASVERFAALG